MTKIKNRTINNSQCVGNVGHFVYAAQSAALPKRAVHVAEQLSTLHSAFLKLLCDENFRTLLRAEAMTMLPVYFKPILDEVKKRAVEND